MEHPAERDIDFAVVEYLKARGCFHVPPSIRHLRFSDQPCVGDPLQCPTSALGRRELAVVEHLPPCEYARVISEGT